MKYLFLIISFISIIFFLSLSVLFATMIFSLYFPDDCLKFAFYYSCILIFYIIIIIMLKIRDKRNLRKYPDDISKQTDFDINSICQINLIITTI